MESRKIDSTLDADLKKHANIDNKEELISDPEKVFRLVSQLEPTLGARFIDYYRETDAFKKLEEKYLSKATDVTLFETACFALATDNIRKINAEDLAIVITILKDKNKENKAVLSCLAGLSFTALVIKNNPEKTEITEYFQWSKILSERTSITFLNLAHANLKKALLNGYDFTGANLRNAQLNEAKLELIQLSGANLSKADFSFAVLLKANMQGANLEGCKLHGACLDTANLEGVTSTKGTNFTGAKLCNANLKNLDLRHIIIDRQFIFQYAQGTVGYANMTSAKLEGANLTGVNLERIILIGSNLKNACLDNATLEGATFFNKKDMELPEGSDEQAALNIIWNQLNDLQIQIDSHPKIHELRQAIANNLATQAQSIDDHAFALKILESAAKHNVFSHRSTLSSIAAWGGTTLVGGLFFNPKTVASASQQILLTARDALKGRVVAHDEEVEVLATGLAGMKMS